MLVKFITLSMVLNFWVSFIINHRITKKDLVILRQTGQIHCREFNDVTLSETYSNLHKSLRLQEDYNKIWGA